MSEWNGEGKYKYVRHTDADMNVSVLLHVMSSIFVFLLPFQNTVHYYRIQNAVRKNIKLCNLPQLQQVPLLLLLQ